LKKGVLTIYDEQAINNDMKIMESNVIVTNHEKSSSSLDELEKLANLKDRGVLTEEEFMIQKARIINK
jgi:hypothetical protein